MSWKMDGRMENKERAATGEIPAVRSESHSGIPSDLSHDEDPPVVVPPLPPEWESEPPSIPAMPPQYDVASGSDPQSYSAPQSLSPIYTPLPYTPRGNMPGGWVKAPFHRNCLIAGMLGLFLGGLGAHRFYLGYYKVGAVMLIAGLLTPVLAWMHIPPVVFLWGFVEGLLCFTGNMRDADGNPLSRW